MKKKILTLFLALILALCAFPAAGFNEGSASPNTKNTSNTISYNTKYILSYDLNLKEQDNQRYIIFYSDGTGKFNYYVKSTYTDEVEHYTITFKYLFIDSSCETVACFHDSTYIYDDNTKYEKNSSWTNMILVSENVLYPQSHFFYVNENYAKTNLQNLGN